MKEEEFKPKYDQSFALVIGINEYRNVSPLSIAVNDAEALAEVLVTKLGFPQDKVAVLLDEQATKTRVLETFLAYEALGRDDRLLVFFAGHGLSVEGHRGPVGYLIPVDGKPEDKSSLIRWDDLTRNAELIPAKHILFIMDACYSGLAILRGIGLGEQRFVSDMLQRFSRQVITAGKADQPVADGGGPTGQNSIFTGHLLEGLRGKAYNEDGVLTASYLMNYVYQRVANDPRSLQTPHFGHLEGDGDFILQTPKGERLNNGADADFLVKPVVEKPEPEQETELPYIKPVFSEKNGYADPDSKSFGHNDWAEKLGSSRWSRESWGKTARASSWLALIVEPVSRQPINLDIDSLAQTLPTHQFPANHPYEKFIMPSESRTTAKAAVLYEPELSRQGQEKEFWKRFLRIERDGCMEYCDCHKTAGLVVLEQGNTGIPMFTYVQTIGVVWTFLFAVKRILSMSDYHGGIRFTVNLVGAKDTVLTQFAAKPGEQGSSWRQPLSAGTIQEGSLQNWKCHDPNIQISFKFILASLGEPEAKKLIIHCAEQIGLAYNHKSKPRCFNYGTDIFPWEQFDYYS